MKKMGGQPSTIIPHIKFSTLIILFIINNRFATTEPAFWYILISEIGIFIAAVKVIQKRENKFYSETPKKKLNKPSEFQALSSTINILSNSILVILCMAFSKFQITSIAFWINVAFLFVVILTNFASVSGEVEWKYIDPQKEYDNLDKYVK